MPIYQIPSCEEPISSFRKANTVNSTKDSGNSALKGAEVKRGLQQDTMRKTTAEYHVSVQVLPMSFRKVGIPVVFSSDERVTVKNHRFYLHGTSFQRNFYIPQRGFLF